VNKMILLVEDEAIIAMNEETVLRKNGYQVKTVHNAGKAIEAAVSPDIDLILMDIDLGKGKMDGTEAAELILRQRELPIVFVTSHTEREMVERVKGITRYGYVVKNSGEFVLLEALQMAFELFNAHRELQTSESKYKTIFANSPLGIFRSTPEGRFIEVNPALADMLGYSSPEEVIEKIYNIAEQIYVDSQKRDPIVQKQLSTQNVERYFNRYKRKDGSIFIANLYLKTIRDEKDAPLYLEGIVEDVTEQIWNEQVAEENRGNIRFLRETAFHFLDTPTKKNIYAYIGDCLHQLNPDAYIILNSVDGKRKKLKTEAIHGIEKHIEKIISILGFHPLGKEYAFDDSLYELADGRLNKFGRGLHELSFGAIPQIVSNTLEKILKVRNIYGIAFIVDGEIYADAVLMLPKNTEISRAETIEAFARQAAIALKRKQTEANLQKSRRQMELFINSSPDFYFLKDTEFRYRICNSANAQFFQRERQDIIGKTDFDLMPADAAEKCMATDKEALEKKEIVRSIEQVGTHVYETLKLPVIEDSSVVGVAGIIRDISEQKQIEQSLRENEEKVKSILDSLSDGIAVMDTNYNVVQTNIKLRDDIGVQSEQDITGKKCYSAFYGFTSQCDWCPAKLVQQHWKSFSKVVPFPEEDPQRWFHLVASPIVNTENELVYIVESARDITLLKKNEQEKDFLMSELNHRVKNNLIMINSLINLKSDSLGEEIDLSDISHQIDTIRIVHEKLYNTTVITHINFRDYVEDLLSTVFSFTELAVQIENDIKVGEIPTKVTIPLGLIINEVATNAIKYGFKKDEKAVFTVSMKEKKDLYILTLSNSGNPFPEDVDFENSDTLGLRLIKVLTTQLDGTIELQKTPHPVFTIRFPLE